MDVILLRKLSPKSKIGFGKYADLCVSEIIKMGKSMYLKYLYCHVDGISFTDEVFNLLYIPQSMRITKPGTNPEMYERFIKSLYAWKIEEDPKIGKIKFKSHQKVIMRARRIGFDKSNRISKAALQSKNHGH